MRSSVDFANWHQELSSGLGHDATIPWTEPCRLSPGRQRAVANLAARAAWLTDVGANWYERLLHQATDPDEGALLALISQTQRTHAHILQRLAVRLGGAEPVSLPPTALPMPPGLSPVEVMAAVHAADLLARVGIQGIVDAVQDDPLVRSVFAMLLYERQSLAAYSRDLLARAGRDGGWRRRQAKAINETMLPVLLTAGWLSMGQDLQTLTGWTWRQTVTRYLAAYERTFSGDLGYLGQRRTLRVLGWLASWGPPGGTA